MTKMAFTPIELLTVVAIIAILAAIAVPNFLDAQVRSKVIRFKAEMRWSAATTIESYYSVDDNHFPIDSAEDARYPRYYPGVGFTAPAAYMANAAGNQQAQKVFGAWLLVPEGLDGATGPLPAGFGDRNNANDWLWQLYDSTNGTVSKGDVISGQSDAANQRGHNIAVSHK